MYLCRRFVYLCLFDLKYTTIDTGFYGPVEKEPDPNRKRSSIKNPRVSWASDDKLLEVREYMVDEEPAATGLSSSSISPPSSIEVSSGPSDSHRNFESARLHELQQERSTFMRILHGL